MGSYESTLLGGFGVGDAGSKGDGADDEGRRQWRSSLFCWKFFLAGNR